MKASEFDTLLSKYIRGEKNAFNKIFEEYFHKLVGAAFLILHNKEDAQNIASDIFLKILSEPNKFLNLNNPSSYLYVTAQNHARNYFRRERQSMKPTEPIAEDVENATTNRIDFYTVLEKYFDKTEQKMLILRCVWDSTYSQIAAELNIPLGTVKSKFRSFKYRLKDKLK